LAREEVIILYLKKALKAPGALDSEPAFHDDLP
jgi:hypothetical protein